MTGVVDGNVRFHGLKSAENVVFFGNNLGTECQRCGAFSQTSNGHKFCARVSCPIALLEFQRRKRKRTSSLEKVYLPRALGRLAVPPAPEPPELGEAVEV